MPQMAPINWLSLFIAFISILMMFSMMYYYNFLPNKIQKNSNKSITNNKMNWSW